jgi:ketosteroid isomerase-like protein
MMGVVRQQVSVADRSSRRFDQRLALRFPGLLSVIAKLVWRLYLLLPPRSRIRRAVASYYVRCAVEALNRGDLEATFMLFDDHSETITPPDFVSLGLEPVYRGREARIALQRRWNQEWGRWRFYPEAVFDLGDHRLLITGSLGGSGLSSGAVVAKDGGFLVALAAGRVIREQIFFDRENALKAAGVHE